MRSRQSEILLHEIESRLRLLANDSAYKKDFSEEEKINLGELADKVSEITIPIEVVEHK